MNVVFEKIGTIGGGQDGTVFKDEIFRMNAAGDCTVFDRNTFEKRGIFSLSKKDIFCPHSNAVCFGSIRCAEDDLYPLFYTNLYNNYARESNRQLGTVGVYQIEKKDGNYTGTLLQIIRIGFADTDLWQSGNRNDVRPYGNAVVDTDRNELWFFTMRDEEQVTRYFRFALPRLTDGVYDSLYGVLTVTLGKRDIISQFDTPYSCYLQGADYHNGRIYSTEGIDIKDNPPKIRVINLAEECEEQIIDLMKLGLPVEPEMIYAYDDCFLYSDSKGNLFRFKV